MKKFLKFLFLLIVIILIGLFVTFYVPHLRPTKEITDPVKPVEIHLNYEKIYLIPNETKQIKSNIDDGIWYSEDDLVATVNNGLITGVSPGKTLIFQKVGKTRVSLEVIVTDLISEPVINNTKPFLGCHQYTFEEAEILDEILDFRLNEIGLNTRAAAVEAARFLSLEFKYRIAYFIENGRLLVTENRTYCDAEGRYYHKGLYLSDNKMSSLLASNHGPAIWGCPLKNGILGRIMNNGLDCSGFVSWALVNAGYDPGDGGAGGRPNIDSDLDDLGDKMPIKEAIKNNTFKVGDLMARYGHIGIIIGVDENNVYIAEALDNDLHVLTSPKNTLNKSWTYVINMDNFYQNDGNITNMW